MKVRLLDELDAWGEPWPAGHEFEVHRVFEGSWEVWFPTRDKRPVIGTVTRRIAEEIPDHATAS